MQNLQTEDIFWGWHVERKSGRILTCGFLQWLHILSSLSVHPYPIGCEVKRKLFIRISRNWIRSQVLPSSVPLLGSQVHFPSYFIMVRLGIELSTIILLCNASSPLGVWQIMLVNLVEWFEKMEGKRSLKISRVRKQYLTIHCFKLLFPIERSITFLNLFSTLCLYVTSNWSIAKMLWFYIINWVYNVLCIWHTLFTVGTSCSKRTVTGVAIRQWHTGTALLTQMWRIMLRFTYWHSFCAKCTFPSSEAVTATEGMWKKIMQQYYQKKSISQ